MVALTLLVQKIETDLALEVMGNEFTSVAATRNRSCSNLSWKLIVASEGDASLATGFACEEITIAFSGVALHVTPVQNIIILGKR